MHTRFTSIINELHSLGEIISRNKLVRKILSILLGSRESKVNAIIEAKDLQKLTIDELNGNMKTYEMKKNKDNERRDPKREKNLVFKTDNNDSSGEDADMAYLRKRLQKMVHRNGGIPKRRSSSKLRGFKRKDVADNVVKHDLAAWGDSSSESGEDDDQGDNSMMAVESEAAEYDSIFALGKTDEDEEDDNDDEGAVKASSQRWYMDSGCSKHLTISTNDFLSLKALQRGSVSFGNGKKGYILGVGRIGKSLTHLIENVYYVNGLKYSLLSVSQICHKGNKVEFVSKICTITNLVSGEVIMMAKRYKNIYVADFESLHNRDITCLSVADDDVELWHRRLGHASFTLLNKLVKKDLVRGLPNSSFKDHKEWEAEIFPRSDWTNIKDVTSSIEEIKMQKDKWNKKVISTKAIHQYEMDKAVKLEDKFVKTRMLLMIS
ncbi:uncharacterized protein LOC142166010 [Nicotiana tabacum]|uniref:Uncharacterized protein LOC142166010 n=1 Tax=Nicotiana tabacum TaxID=4097 RepID=A0AC58S688_TOBAC